MGAVPRLRGERSILPRPNTRLSPLTRKHWQHATAGYRAPPSRHAAAGRGPLDSPGRRGGWPEKWRVFVRRERPRPGAQLSLFEAEDGWRYSPWVTNRPAATWGWLSPAAYIDAAHRVHARVEDGIRTGKDCGIGKYPSTSLAMNKARQTAA
jgi:hypothetical protein